MKKTLLTFTLILSGFIALANPCQSFQTGYAKKIYMNSPSCLDMTPGLSPAKRKEIVDLTIKYAKIYNVKPWIPLGVARTESSYRGQEFRIGKVGSKKSGGPFYAPFNIHYSYLTERGWPIHTLEGNVEAGVRCFANMSEAQALKRLRTYNRKCNSQYLSAVQAAIRRYEKELKEK